jgi:hypothetical protein
VAAFHPHPDPQGDPWGVPYAEAGNGSRVDYMQATYDAFLYPTAVFDGVDRMASASGFLQTYNAYESAYEDRVVVDAPLRLGLIGARVGPMALLEVAVTAKAAVDSSNLSMRAVLFEDDLRFDGGNGVDLHRFTVRHVFNETRVALDAAGRANRTLAVPMDPDWRGDRVGFVVWVVSHDGASRAFRQGEVLQSATYLLSQQGPTIQASRGVLLEFYTATWCPTCLWGDGAVDELANSFGVASSRILDRPYQYLRPFDLATVAGGAAVAVAVAAFVVWTRPRGGGAP